ncbi:MAG: GNAT family N-acetyltransferase [Candidatus Krumholzibacteriota bacterium]|nr:GNAT family N-acetyltransferase [Candidatus Krumholzibacteriota bacterium]
MRRSRKQMPRQEALALLADAPVHELAAVLPDGRPLLRHLHGVRLDEHLVFHCALAGEKAAAAGGPAVAGAAEVVAEIPSTFRDGPGCGATTWYRSALAEGRLEWLAESDRKARALAALMAKHQPDGGWTPLDPVAPGDARTLAGVGVLALRLERISGRRELGQSMADDERRRVLVHLWRRGRPADLRAVDASLAAFPLDPPPAFLAAPAGARLICAPGPERLDEALGLLEGAYWLADVTPDAIRRAHRLSGAWTGAVAADTGELVATARAAGDGTRQEWLFDIVVRPDWRGRGLGRALVRLILDHPRLRGCARIRLATRDAQDFYAAFGFRVDAAAGAAGGRHDVMVLDRQA